MPESAALLRRLRKHCNGGGRRCRCCWPSRGIYCPVALPLAEAFAAARRAEVLVARLAA